MVGALCYFGAPPRGSALTLDAFEIRRPDVALLFTSLRNSTPGYCAPALGAVRVNAVILFHTGCLEV